MTFSETKTNRIITAAVALGFVILCAKVFLSSGHTYSFDGAFHTAQAQMVYNSLREGEFPLWTNRWYQGYPLLQLYPPMFFYLAAFLNFLVGNMITTIKLMAFAGQVLSGITAFLLVKEVTDDQQAGLIGGLAFGAAPWHFFQILDFCRHTVSFVYAFLPLPFLFYERFRKGKLNFVQAGILAGASLAVIVSFQYGYALYITFLFIIYVALGSIRKNKPFFDPTHLWFLLICGVVCLGLSSAFIGPFLLSKSTSSQYVMSLKKFNVDSADFSSLITRRNIPNLHKGYIGLSFLLLSVAGVFSAFRTRKYPLLFMYFFCFFLVLGHSTSLYRYIPLIYTQQATERMILYLVLFMGVLAGEGLKFLKNQLSPLISRANWPGVFICLIIVCFWDVSVVRDRHWSGIHAMHKFNKPFAESLPSSDLSHLRTIRALHVCSLAPVIWLFEQVLPATFTIETPLSVVGMRFDPKKIQYSLLGTKWIRQDLDNRNTLSLSQRFLYLLNVSYLIYINPKGNIRVINNSVASPAVASGHLGWNREFSQADQIGETGMIKPLIAEMKIDPKRNGARRIFLMEKKGFPDRPFNDNSRLRVTDFQQTINQSFLEVDVTHDCYLQLSHTYFPYLRVYVDAQPTPFYESVFSTISLPLPAGKHRIKIEPYLSPTAKVGYLISLISLISALVFYFRYKQSAD